MKKRFLLFLLCFVFLTACGNSDSNHHDHANHEAKAEESLKPLKVEFLTESDAFQPKVEGTMKVKVTKGDENVSDATQVQFEIWKKGERDESKKFEAENKGAGVYSLKHTFKEKSIYQVISHVTARGSHTMPTKEYNVGDVK